MLKPIDITTNPYHWKFIKLMEMDEKILWYSKNQNSCAYLRIFILSLLKFSAISTLVLLSTYMMVSSAVITVIYFYFAGFNPDLILGDESVFWIYRVGFFAWLVISLIAAIAFLAVFCFILLNDKFPRLVNRVTKLIKNDSMFQMIKAKHDKICLPIKVNDDK